MGTAQERQNESTDAIFKAQVQRLHHLTVALRWLAIGLLWLTVGSLSLWSLRSEIDMLRSHFTWAAVYYGMYHNQVPTLGLGFCIATTTAVLVWQSRNILLGMPPQYQKRLERGVCRIRQQGPTHPLWKWICQK
jgi:hypothetical protein